MRNGLLEMTIGFLRLGGPFKPGRTVGGCPKMDEFSFEGTCSRTKQGSNQNNLHTIDKVHAG